MFSLLFHVSLCATSQSWAGTGDPAVWEDQGCERGAAGASQSDLPGTGREFLRVSPDDILVKITIS